MLKWEKVIMVRKWIGMNLSSTRSRKKWLLREEIKVKSMKNAMKERDAPCLTDYSCWFWGFCNLLKKRTASMFERKSQSMFLFNFFFNHFFNFYFFRRNFWHVKTLFPLNSNLRKITTNNPWSVWTLWSL